MTSHLDACNETIEPNMDQLADACEQASSPIVCSCKTTAAARPTSSRANALYQEIKPLIDKLSEACDNCGLSMICNIAVDNDDGSIESFTSVLMTNEKVTVDQNKALVALGFFDD